MAGFKPVLRDTAKEWRRILYSRINNLFDYENLPEEIDEKSFKLFLNRCGKIVFYKIGDKFLIQPFAYTDKLNWYYIPKYGRVVNPWLPQGHQNYEFEVEKSAVIYNCTPDIYNFANGVWLQTLFIKLHINLLKMIYHIIVFSVIID